MSDDSLADTLSLLAHDVRIDILRSLAADGPLSFSELKSRVGVRDSGRFNYHLTELCRRFLRETEDGYDLNYRGERLVVAAGGADPGSVEGEASPYESADEATLGDSDRTDACPVCGKGGCDRLIHVHLDTPGLG